MLANFVPCFVVACFVMGIVDDAVDDAVDGAVDGAALGVDELSNTIAVPYVDASRHRLRNANIVIHRHLE